MERKQVKSSNLKSVGFDGQNKVLEIEFWKGSIYQYFKVPQQIYDELMKASSLGTYHHRKIKGRYRYVRIR